MIGPENDTDSSDWDAATDHVLPGKTSAFTYNADPPEIGPREFPEPDDVEAPEKM